ncbi:MAG: hypothetical protein ABSG64_01305 [Solirubrobacteraceae bacterium]|jgi:hypothetical protein
MTRSRRLLIALLCTCCPLFAQSAVASAHPLVGLGDNKTQLFSDPRFLALGITQVRYDMPWDALTATTYSGNYESTRLQQWLTMAQQDGLTPLITFDHSSLSGHAGKLPTVKQYSAAFVKFHELYPWVTEFVTWDESNFHGEPTWNHPTLVAQYYKALRKDCPSCTILAAELLDVPRSNGGVPIKQYTHAMIHYLHSQPGYWGINNYVGANTLSTTTTKQLLHAVTGKIWFTETAGLVSRHNSSHVHFTQNATHAATVDKFILTKLAGLSPRIQRVYLYEWNAMTSYDSWDSALISWTGVPRPAYDVLANTLDSWGIKPNCALSNVPPACAASGATGASGPSGSS